MNIRSPATAQRGAVLITAIIISMMAAMLASTSMRSSTYAVAMAQSHVEQITVERAASFALDDFMARGPFAANTRRSERRFPVRRGIRVTTITEQIGESATIPISTYQPVRDRDLKVVLYEISVTAEGPRGYRSTQGATLFHVAAANQRTGDLPRRLDSAQTRFGATWWVVSRRQIP